MEYLQDSDYQIAAANGIGRSTAHSRFYDYGWSRERTINTPVLKKDNLKKWEEWREVAEVNGINKQQFLQRLFHGKTPKEAATMPIGQLRKTLIPRDKLAIAEANGISIGTVRTRVRRGWTIEKAISHPVDVTKRAKGS